MQRSTVCPPNVFKICLARAFAHILSFILAADAPSKDIHAFIGTFTINSPPSVSSNEVPMVQVPTVESLSVENVLWANTVLASGSAIGFVVYTGSETRAVMNTSHPQTKVGLLDLEISQLAKVHCS
jgi:phospholipid-translocating ATPase